MSTPRFGLICDLDAAKGLARVYFAEDEKTSSWIPIVVPNTKVHKFSLPFDINEHVCCLMDENCEYGAILGAIYDEDNQPTAAVTGNIDIVLDGNTTIQYNRNSQSLSFNAKGDVTIKSAENVTVEGAKKIIVKAMDIELDGNVTVSGTLAAASIATTGGGNMEVDGSIDIKGDATIGGKSFSQHKHTVGSSTSTPPI